jgi:hypothetical protein
MRKELLTSRDDLFVIHSFFSTEECQQQITLAEEAGFGDAPINSLAGPVVRKRIRNNDRVMIDSRQLATAIWERLRPLLPEPTRFWKPVGLNERFRYYRYEPGQLFDWHLDGCYERSPTEQSTLTFMIYLNGDLAGGATEFSGVHGERIVSVHPETGKALVFPHRILHRGAPVAEGRKYVLRTDVMCRWSEATGE